MRQRASIIIGDRRVCTRCGSGNFRASKGSGVKCRPCQYAKKREKRKSGLPIGADGLTTAQRTSMRQKFKDRCSKPMWIRGVPSCRCGMKFRKYKEHEKPKTPLFPVGKYVPKFRDITIPHQKCACYWSSDSYKDQHKNWRTNNPGTYLAKKARHRARKRRAMPEWLDEEQHMKIESMYIDAQFLTTFTGIEHHVDHIIPLAGEDICGLHVPWNLQVMPAADNIRKSNKTGTHWDSKAAP